MARKGIDLSETQREVGTKILRLRHEIEYSVSVDQHLITYHSRAFEDMFKGTAFTHPSTFGIVGNEEIVITELSDINWRVSKESPSCLKLGVVDVKVMGQETGVKAKKMAILLYRFSSVNAHVKKYLANTPGVFLTNEERREALKLLAGGHTIQVLAFVEEGAKAGKAQPSTGLHESRLRLDRFFKPKGPKEEE